MNFQMFFSKIDFDKGCLSGMEHKINTYDEIPNVEKIHKTPLQFQKAEQEYIDKLLQQGVIGPSVPSTIMSSVYLLDFFCSSIQIYLLLSPYLCFISLLYLDLYVLGDDALIS